MKLDGFPEEKTILSFKLANGVGWLTTHRLIIQQEKFNQHFKIIESQAPEMYYLTDFEKAEIKDEALTIFFKRGQQAKIRLHLYSPLLFQEIKDYIEKAAEKGKILPQEN
jgi:hypothetical protein